jgi:phosphate starvation-inducible protein PhoH
MMQTQIDTRKPSLPKFVEGKTAKDNDLLRVVEAKGLKFSSGQLQSGKTYLTTIWSVLW